MTFKSDRIDDYLLFKPYYCSKINIIHDLIHLNYCRLSRLSYSDSFRFDFCGDLMMKPKIVNRSIHIHMRSNNNNKQLFLII